MKFEYKTVKIAKDILFKTKNDPTVNSQKQEEFDKMLNDLGNDGWELIEIIDPKGFLGLGDEGYCIFKKKID